MLNLNAQLLLHNSHLSDPMSFADEDPQLKALKHQIYTYHPPLLDELPINIPGVYTITGGRQIGKSTLSKQWMLHLLKQGK